VKPAYHWVEVPAGRHHFLEPLFASLGVAHLRVWADAGVGAATLSRKACGGHVHALAEVSGREIALTWTDFRVESATYSREVSQRFAAYIRQLGDEDIPLVYVVNSAGVSLMGGRAAFSDAFALWPQLLRFSERHLLLTCAAQKCLGLAPVLFGLGHYRTAVAGDTQLNLTGPKVFQMFFGDDVDFDRGAAAERFLERTDLVHELFPSTELAVGRLLDIALGRPAAPCVEGAAGSDTTLGLFEGLLDGSALELAPGLDSTVRLFLGRFRGRPLGLFANPPGRPENLVTVRCLEKYAAGLDLFARLGVPVVSFVDAPGIDPRFEQSDANSVRAMLRVGERIIRYPHGSMGVVVGRCFGGASSLAFPKVFGGTRVVALRGARIGSMMDSIVDRLLEKSPRLLAQWHETQASQLPGMEDLLAQGTLDAVVDREGLSAEFVRFLGECPAATARASAPPAARDVSHPRANGTEAGSVPAARRHP
jgi:acetyl-CoA carboxylase carboxyltransferase component